MRRPLRFLFSGYFVSAILIVLEVIALFWIFLELSAYSAYVLLGGLLISLFSVLAVINANYSPEYKVTWIVVIFGLPFFGTLLFVLFKRKKMSRRDSKRMRLALEKMSEFYDGEAFESLKAQDRDAAGRATAILNHSPLAGIYKGTGSEFFSDGDLMYESMLRDLEGAKEYIFLEYFIIEDGVMWRGIYDILKRKAAQGVEIRLLYDDVGCMSTLPRGFSRRLRSDGIEVACFGRVSPRISSAHNNRDHRKILVIDGVVGYTGGINIADEYINEVKRFGFWKDGGIRLEGDAVKGFARMFLVMWDITQGVTSDYGKYLTRGTTDTEKEGETVDDGGYYLTYGSGPLPIYPIHVGERAFLDLINRAERYLYITTPYLIVGYDLTDALRGAAQRGVDVRIITPRAADKKLVKLLTKSSYPYLMEAGVKIYEYVPGFIHEKTLVSDDAYAIVGSINFDYRSLIHHYENAVWMYGTPTVPLIRESFEQTLRETELMTRKRARLTVKEWIVRCLVRLIAPLL